MEHNGIQCSTVLLFRMCSEATSRREPRIYIEPCTQESLRDERPDPTQLFFSFIWEEYQHLASLRSLKIPVDYNAWSLTRPMDDPLSNKEFHDMLTSLMQYGWGDHVQSQTKLCMRVHTCTYVLESWAPEIVITNLLKSNGNTS